MNDFYIESKHLNIKKVVIISVILITILILIIVLIAKKISKTQNNSEKNTTVEIADTSTIFYGADNSISIELSNTFGLKPYNSNLSYLLELRSENQLNIFIAKENTVPNKDLSEIVEADKIAYLANFESYSNLSDIKQLSINNNPAYTYSFHYLDKKLNKAFYLQVTWLQVGSEFYIFDIEFPLDDLPFNTNISSSVLSSFKILNLKSTK